jgi:hypothetical protein
LLEVLELGVYADATTITALGTNCPNLQSLELRLRDGALSDTDITALAQGCPRLRTLGMHFTSPASMEGISALATHYPRLRKVHVGQDVLGITHKYGQRVLPGRKLRPVKCFGNSRRSLVSL